MQAHVHDAMLSFAVTNAYASAMGSVVAALVRRAPLAWVRMGACASGPIVSSTVWAAFALSLWWRVWCALHLLIEAGSGSGLAWLPAGLGGDLVVACVCGLVVAAVSTLLGRALPQVVVVVAALVCAALDAWLTVNLASWRLSLQVITWERLRGDEGVTFQDVRLVSLHDVLPVLAFAVSSVVLAVVVARVRLRHALLSSPRRFVVACLVGAALYASNAMWWAPRNFGMGDHPVLVLARTWVRARLHLGNPSLPRSQAPPTTMQQRRELLRAHELQPAEVDVTPARAHPQVDNAIVFFAEGIGRRHTGLEHDGLTPHLLARMNAQGGLDATRWYSPYHKSIAALFSMFCSDWPPPDARNIMEINPRIDCGSLAEQMKEHGIHAGLFHGGDFGFYDKLQLMGLRGFEIQQDARALHDDGMWQNEWGTDDRAVVDATLRWIDALPRGERFAAVIIPITAHYPYDYPPDVTHPAAWSLKAQYLAAGGFLDDVFERLVAGLQDRGLLENTAILYTGDHGETVGEAPRASAGRRLFYEPSVHVPFVIFSPSQFPSRTTTNRIASHVDLLPTMLDLLGLPPDPRHHGQSLLADDFEPRRVFLGASNGPRYVGFVDGDWKAIVNRSDNGLELYNLHDDPEEHRNLASVLPGYALDRAVEAVAFATGQLEHLKTARALPDEVDTQEALLREATVSVVQGDRRFACRAVAPSAPAPLDDASLRASGFANLPGRHECEGLAHAPVLGEALVKAGGSRRRCVLIDVPDGGGDVLLQVSQQPWLPFLARVRAADLPGSDKADDVVITGFGDGKQGQEHGVTHNARDNRIAFPSPSHDVTIRVRGDHRLNLPVCLTFTEKAWRGTRATDDANDPDDDAHGVPRLVVDPAP